MRDLGGDKIIYYKLQHFGDEVLNVRCKAPMYIKLIDPEAWVRVEPMGNYVRAIGLDNTIHQVSDFIHPKTFLISDYIWVVQAETHLAVSEHNLKTDFYTYMSEMVLENGEIIQKSIPEMYRYLLELGTRPKDTVYTRMLEECRI
jgi:hypothetical protein